MIYDSFMYFNEAVLLTLRLAELNSWVDRFVVVESNQTLTGMPKPYYFDDIPIEVLRPYLGKILRVKVKFPHDDMTPWERETFQRDALVLSDMLPDDIVVMSDADEIPAPWSILDFSQGEFGPRQLDVDQYFWNFNWKVPAHCNQGARPVISRFKDITTPQEMRADTTMERISNAGWHFSFFLDNASDVSTKVGSYSHTEMNQASYLNEEAIQERIKLGIDPFDRFPLKYTPIGDNHPYLLRNNLDLYRKWVMDNPWNN